MPAITIVRQDHVPLTEQQRETLRTALFGLIDGLDDGNRRAWRRFWNWMLRLEPGEVASIETRIPRHLGFHRRHMAIEQAIFKAQDRMASFEQFRNWLKIGAGFCDFLPSRDGHLVAVPKTINFADCDEEAMRQFHDDAVTFLRTEGATHFLWPHLDDRRGAEMVEAVLERFNEL
jgi:hypothetical protein